MFLGYKGFLFEEFEYLKSSNVFGIQIFLGYNWRALRLVRCCSPLFHPRHGLAVIGEIRIVFFHGNLRYWIGSSHLVHQVVLPCS